MAKFSVLSLRGRKSGTPLLRSSTLGTTPLGSSSDISALVDTHPSLGETPATSRTLPRLKSKGFFSFRRFGAPRSGSVKVVQPFDHQAVSGQQPCDDDDADPTLTSASLKTPTFATVLFRRSTLSRDRHHIQSETLTHSNSSESTSVGRLSSTTFLLDDGKPHEANYYGSGDSDDRTSSESARSGLFTPFTRAFAVQSLDDHHQGDSALVYSLFKASDTSLLGSASSLPPPPIIISAPTPPDLCCLEGQRNDSYSTASVDVVEYTKAPIDLTDLEEDPGFNFRIIVESLQRAARQLEDDPTFTKGNLYYVSAPVVVFLYLLVIGVITPRKHAHIIKTLGVDEGSISAGIIFSLWMILGMFLALACLKFVISVMGRLGHSFCDLDVDEAFSKGVCVDSEGELFGEADLIVGNLLRK